MRVAQSLMTDDLMIHYFFPLPGDAPGKGKTSLISSCHHLRQYANRRGTAQLSSVTGIIA